MRSSSENQGLDRVRHQLRSSAAGDGPGDGLRSGIHSRGYLPHVKRDGAEYFVTFRLGDSLPREKKAYLLREWVIMPNHVHVLVWPLPDYRISDIVKTWKQFTSLRAKRILGLPEGRFWQPEVFDHWIRDDDERARIAAYIRNNPVTARLCASPEGWRWSSAWRDTPAS